MQGKGLHEPSVNLVLTAWTLQPRAGRDAGIRPGSYGNSLFSSSLDTANLLAYSTTRQEDFEHL